MITTYRNKKLASKCQDKAAGAAAVRAQPVNVHYIHGQWNRVCVSVAMCVGICICGLLCMLMEPPCTP